MKTLLSLVTALLIAISLSSCSTTKSSILRYGNTQHLLLKEGAYGMTYNQLVEQVGPPYMLVDENVGGKVYLFQFGQTFGLFHRCRYVFFDPYGRVVYLGKIINCPSKPKDGNKPCLTVSIRRQR